jgi:SAM-dependent methyltransferase
MNALENQIQALAPWQYNITLPDGTCTMANGQDNLMDKQWQLIKHSIPGDLTGWKVLEIGCSNGFLAIEMAKRGAKVLVADTSPHCLKQAEWVVRQFHFQHLVWVKKIHLYDLARLNMQFDLVLCVGAMYTLRYPQLALDIICRRASQMVMFRSPYTAALNGPDALLADWQFTVTRTFENIYVAEWQTTGDTAPNPFAREELNSATGVQQRQKGRRKRRIV